MQREAREKESELRAERKRAAASVDALEAELEKTRRDATAAASKAAAAAREADEQTRRRALVTSSSAAFPKTSGSSVHPSAQPKKRADVLGGLGLESVSVAGAGGATRDGGAVSLRSRRAPGSNRGGAKAVFGAFSIRTWLLVAYLVCLHVMAMVTPRHNVGCAIDQDKHRLPGML